MKTKIEGGSGGKKGHSNMTHWTPTEEIKKGNKKKRRSNDRTIVREAFKMIVERLREKEEKVR